MVRKWRRYKVFVVGDSGKRHPPSGKRHPPHAMKITNAIRDFIKRHKGCDG